MLHILVSDITPRVQYTLDWIFNERLKIPYTLCTEKKTWDEVNAAKINYTDTPSEFANQEIHIRPNGILFQESIQPISINYNRWKHTSILFYNQPGKEIPFDLFGATFFLLSRYEEYLPFKSDKHNRFQSKNSIAAQYHFLQEPVVDKWLAQLAKIIKKRFSIHSHEHTFQFIPSYDIDIAYNYLHKSTLHHIAASARDMLAMKWKNILERWNTLKKSGNDPYDCFDWLKKLHTENELTPIYFWLASTNQSAFDNNNPRNSSYMRQLYNQHKEHGKNGIHPSYFANTSEAAFKDELIFLKQYFGDIKLSRQHYIKLHLPNTYKKLIAENINEDYTMGYADANGFRAGTSNSFKWFDLVENKTTALHVHPFCYMEATSIFYLKQNPEEAYQELERLYWEIKKTNGTMITIFHNYTLGESLAYKGWRRIYQDFIAMITNKDFKKFVL